MCRSRALIGWAGDTCAWRGHRFEAGGGKQRALLIVQRRSYSPAHVVQQPRECVFSWSRSGFTPKTSHTHTDTDTHSYKHTKQMRFKLKARLYKQNQSFFFFTLLHSFNAVLKQKTFSKIPLSLAHTPTFSMTTLTHTITSWITIRV